MLHELDLILTLTLGLAVALVLGYLSRKLKASPLVGYLLAGIVVGPHTPGFIADASLSGQLAEVGVILLMFGVGLHFHPRELLAVRKTAIPGAVIQSTVTTFITLLVCLGFGWDWTNGLLFGIAISVSSTVVLTRILEDNRLLHTPDGHIAMGWLIIEDILTILALVVVPLFFGVNSKGEAGAGDPGSTVISLGLVVLKLVALFLASWLLGRRLIPALLGFVARTGSRELFTLSVLVTALGIALASSVFFGASMALGAFLAGMIVRQSDFSTRAAAEALPMRDAFAVLFFVSVGMLFDPLGLLAELPLTLAILGLVLLGKVLVAFLLVLVLGRPVSSALRIAVALGQIGEFSFILASLAIELKIMPLKGMNILVAVAMVSIALNPFLFGLARRLAKAADRHRRVPASEDPQTMHDSAAHKMILVGFGPVGETLHAILVSQGIQTKVIEMNLETVQKLKSRGIPAVYGDACSRETLVASGLEDARCLIVSAPGVAAPELARLAREVNPGVRILFRADFLREVPTVWESGVDAVFSGEGEVALAMTANLLKDLGATDEQIGREQDRIRKEILGNAGRAGAQEQD